MKPCKGCKRPVDPLEIFPGGICLECYAASEEGQRPLTADDVSGLWRKVV